MLLRLAKSVKNLIDEVILTNKAHVLFVWHHEIRLGNSLRCSGIYYQSYNACCVHLNSGGFTRHSTHFILRSSTSCSCRYAIVCAVNSSSFLHSSNPMSPTSRSTLKRKYGNCLSTSVERAARRTRRCICSESVISFDNAPAILIKARIPGGKFVAVFQPGMNETMEGTNDLTCSKIERSVVKLSWSLFALELSIISTALR